MLSVVKDFILPFLLEDSCGDYRQVSSDAEGSVFSSVRKRPGPRTRKASYKPPHPPRKMKELSVSVSDRQLSWNGEEDLALQLLNTPYNRIFDEKVQEDKENLILTGRCNYGYTSTLIARGSSIGSSSSSGYLSGSWESLVSILSTPTPPPQEVLENGSSGFEIKFDLGVTLNDFQTSVLPTGDIDMYMQNRSQYHRLSSYGETEEFNKEMCPCCSFCYYVPIQRN